jgi:putative DNA primase/helicase
MKKSKSNEMVPGNTGSERKAIEVSSSEIKKPNCAEMVRRFIRRQVKSSISEEVCLGNVVNWLSKAGYSMSEQDVNALIKEVYPKHKSNPERKSMAEIIREKYQIINSANKYYQYTNGYYREIKPEQVRLHILKNFKKVNMYKVKETEYFLQSLAYIDPCRINATHLLNLKNGMFDINTYTLYPHSPDLYSTIRLEVEFTKDAKCERWVKTIDEILDHESGQVLQEFFGLCLTKETKYEKALVCLGEGANGKSVVLGVLGELLGKDNYSAIPLESFCKSYYIAKLFGKLANISTEASATGEIYDSIFKSIISGDAVDADAKYGHPFTFRPFCKLVLATNNLPRVDDRTNAFYRRMIVLEFKRQFKEEEQNKNLRTELLSEVNGIFLWALEGLRGLRQRDRFQISESMKEAIAQYRKENNPVIPFVEEMCVLDQGYHVSKKDLYEVYGNWCKEGNYKPLSKIKFGRELKRHLPGIDEDRESDGVRDSLWLGIAIKEDSGLDMPRPLFDRANPFLSGHTITA